MGAKVDGGPDAVLCLLAPPASPDPRNGGIGATAKSARFSFGGVLRVEGRVVEGGGDGIGGR